MNNQQNDDVIFFKSFYCIKRLTHFNKIKLSPTAKDIYLFMVSLDSSGLSIYPSIGRLSEMFGVGADAVKAGLKALHDAGMISSIMRMDNSKVYTILLKPEQISQIVNKDEPNPVIANESPSEPKPESKLNSIFSSYCENDDEEEDLSIPEYEES